jgi:hypothetical protein
MIATSVKQIQPNEIAVFVEQHSKRIQKLNDSFNELFLLSPPTELIERSLELLNFIARTPFESYQKGEYQQLSDTLQRIKTDVLNEAQRFVKIEQQRKSDLVDNWK